jgi:hypothetical protein
MREFLDPLNPSLNLTVKSYWVPREECPAVNKTKHSGLEMQTLQISLGGISV